MTDLKDTDTWTFGPGRAGNASGEKMGPKTRGGLFAQDLPAELGLGLLLVASLCRFPGGGPQPVHKERATTNSRPPAISYLGPYRTCALAAAARAGFLAAAAIAEGSAKAITASPSVLMVAGLPPKG